MSEFSENDLVADTSSLLTNHYSSQPQPLLFTDKKRKAKKKEERKQRPREAKRLARKQMANHPGLLVQSLTFLPQNTYYVQVLCYTINVFP